MLAFLPTLIVRTKDIPAAIEVNGAPAGDASPHAHLAIPISDTGEYYIGIYPQYSGISRYYPVMRKLCFRAGRLLPPAAEDVEAFVWPNGITETVFSPGKLIRNEAPVFPYTVDQLELGEDAAGMLTATMYYDHGMHFAVEQQQRVLYGAVMGPYTQGHLVRGEGGLLAAIAGRPALPPEDAPEGYGRVLIAIDADYKEQLHIKGDAVGFYGKEAVAFMRLNTVMGHDRKQKYRYESGAFFESPPETGFFTHSPERPAPGRAMLRAFCEAVQHGLWEEAYSFLTPSLREGLTEEDIRGCMGAFIGCRAPIEHEDRAIGLYYPMEDGVTPVRLFSFTFEDGLIDNLSEEL